MAVARAIEPGGLGRRPASEANRPPVVAHRRGLSPARVLTLQRTAGNHAVTRALASWTAAGWPAAGRGRLSVLSALGDQTLLEEYETVLARILALGTAAERDLDQYYLERIVEELLLRYARDAHTSLEGKRGARRRPMAGTGKGDGGPERPPPERLPESREESEERQQVASEAGPQPEEAEAQPTTADREGEPSPAPDAQQPAPDREAAVTEPGDQKTVPARERPAPSADPNEGPRRGARPAKEGGEATQKPRRLPSLGAKAPAVAGAALSVVGGPAAIKALKRAGTGRTEVELGGLRPRDFKLGREWHNVPLGSDEHERPLLGTVRVERNPHRRKRFYLVRVRAG